MRFIGDDNQPGCLWICCVILPIAFCGWFYGRYTAFQENSAKKVLAKEKVVLFEVREGNSKISDSLGETYSVLVASRKPDAVHLDDDTTYSFYLITEHLDKDYPPVKVLEVIESSQYGPLYVPFYAIYAKDGFGRYRQWLKNNKYDPADYRFVVGENIMPSEPSRNDSSPTVRAFFYTGNPFTSGMWEYRHNKLTGLDRSRTLRRANEKYISDVQSVVTKE